MKDGGPAFPASQYMDSFGQIYTSEPTGMSLRDWFAGLAMQGFLSQQVIWEDRECAARAYKVANAMIAERDRREEKPSNSDVFGYAKRGEEKP